MTKKILKKTLWRCVMKCIDFQDEAAKNPDHWINDGLKITLQKN